MGLVVHGYRRKWGSINFICKRYMDLKAELLSLQLLEIGVDTTDIIALMSNYILNMTPQTLIRNQLFLPANI